MLKKLLAKLIDSDEKQIARLQPLVNKINALEPETKKLSDSRLNQKTAEFKTRLAGGETLDDLLPEAFAVIRETSRRVLSLRHYDVQLIAGIVFHQGKIAEQKTGEGKTLSATTTLYLNALTGRGCHLITVNDYLARRDAGWMAPIYHFLGLSTGVIYSGTGQQPAVLYDPEYDDKSATDDRLRHLRPIPRRQAYQADITYGTNNEFGFDYLRDNMAQSLERMVQTNIKNDPGAHHFAIVDEVDSILIDEARTPLIISAPDSEPTDKYFQFARLVKDLNQDTDYEIDEKLKTANLTEHGLRKIEKKLGIDNLYEKDFDMIHHLENALRARTLFLKDRDYVVKQGEVIIVDEFTGRLMYGRRYSEGMHQAIEAKEGVTIKQESKTLATISFQNYFRLYEKLAGMTGTAATEAEEFVKIYDLDVVVIPTNEPIIRIDHTDVVYKTVRAKYAAVVADIEDCCRRGQPVLIGTTSVEKNQIISEFLKRKKIPHNVLNAKNHLKEAEIIAQAGKVKGVTVATNMAGRGVDIVLGGDPEGRKQADWQVEHDKVKQLGGLHVIGTERHESRRIDNQLRGRSGRQGDPGSTRFYVSLEDDIMRLFGGDQVAKIMDAFKLPEDQPLEHSMVSKAIAQSQTKVEGFHFDSRKHVVEYDDVMNKQREIIYALRREILEKADRVNDKIKPEDNTALKDLIIEKLETDISTLVLSFAAEGYVKPEYDKLVQGFIEIVPLDNSSQTQLKTKLKSLAQSDEIIHELVKLVHQIYQTREKQLSPAIMRQVERFVTLGTIDKLWMEHLDAIDDLRSGIGLRGYAQRDPLVEYKKEAYTMFERLIATIDHEIVRRVFRVQPIGTQPPQSVIPEDAVATHPHVNTSTTPGQPAPTRDTQLAPASPKNRDPNTGKKIGRNDPCWCGKKKPNGQPVKYKHCHGR